MTLHLLLSRTVVVCVTADTLILYGGAASEKCLPGNSAHMVTEGPVTDEVLSRTS